MNKSNYVYDQNIACSLVNSMYADAFIKEERKYLPIR